VQLGDVYAHFGMWPAASTAWNSALDALLGPYQVVSSWTRKLELGCGWQQLLGRYGVHGLLLAGTLLGKLARCAGSSTGTEQIYSSYVIKQLARLFTASAIFVVEHSGCICVQPHTYSMPRCMCTAPRANGAALLCPFAHPMSLLLLLRPLLLLQICVPRQSRQQAELCTPCRGAAASSVCSQHHTPAACCGLCNVRACGDLARR
jgi:hypothetical protein